MSGSPPPPKVTNPRTLASLTDEEADAVVWRCLNRVNQLADSHARFIRDHEAGLRGIWDELGGPVGGRPRLIGLHLPAAGPRYLTPADGDITWEDDVRSSPTRKPGQKTVALREDSVDSNPRQKPVPISISASPQKGLGLVTPASERSCLSALSTPRSRFPSEVLSQNTYRSTQAALKIPEAGYCPERAFVVNIQRLVDMNEVLDLLHEFIKNTAIAALTVVAADSVRQMFNTIIFLFATFCVFADHNARFDRLDVTDMVCIARMHVPQPADNQNQILKALSVGKGQRGLWFTVLITFLEVSLMTFCWVACVIGWTAYGGSCESDDLPPLPPDLQNTVRILVDCPDDLYAFTAQLLVLSSMFTFHIAFTVIHMYETRGIMPKTSDGRVWDVRRDGVPPGYRYFGLPSMWFTGQEVYDDLLRWVNGLCPGHTVNECYPEEIALYALHGDDVMREELAYTMREARLFDADELKEPDPPRKLDIDLCFYSHNMKSEGMPFKGDYATIIGSGARGGVMNTILVASAEWGTRERFTTDSLLAPAASVLGDATTSDADGSADRGSSKKEQEGLERGAPKEASEQGTKVKEL